MIDNCKSRIRIPKSVPQKKHPFFERYLSLAPALLYHALILCLIVTALGSWTQAYATEMIIGSANAAPGQEFSVNATLEPGTRVAGIKMVLGYDADILMFVKAEKLEAANGMMFVVNDRNPGKLIIVMAGASGIDLPRADLLKLVFRVRDPIRNTMKTQIQLLEIEAKSDSLKQVQIHSRSGEVDILIDKVSCTGFTYNLGYQ